MSINYGPGYDPQDQQTGTGTGLSIVATWSDLAGREPAVVGSEVIVSNIAGATDVLARRGTNAWYIPGTNQVVKRFVSNNQIPLKTPTAPKRRRILGRTSNTQGGIFDAGVNTADWWPYSSYSIAGPTRLTVDTRFINQTGKTIDKVAIPFLGTHATNSTILALWIGRGGIDHVVTTTQRMTFGGQNTVTPEPGDPFLATYVVSDLLVLDTPWQPDEEILIRVVFENSGHVESFDSIGTLANGESGMARCWIGLGDGGSSAGQLSNASSLTWIGNWAAPFCNVFVEFAPTEDPEISILVCGDSVTNQWKSYLDTLPMVRDGWQYFLEQLNTTTNWHVAIAGNGGYDVPQYCDRLMSTLGMYNGWVDVVCLEGWTPNGTMQTRQELAYWKSQVVSLRERVLNAGMEWLVVLNSPLGEELMQYEFGQPVKDRHLEMIAWHNERFPNRVIDMRFSTRDPNNPDHFAPGMSLDDAHYTRAANVKWATDFKPIMAEKLQQVIGYTITE